MAEVLRWTPLRHEMLAEIEVDIAQHHRDAATPTDLLGDPEQPPSHLLGDCTCGQTVLVPCGEAEFERLNEANAHHVAEAVLAVLARWDAKHPEVSGG